MTRSSANKRPALLCSHTLCLAAMLASAAAVGDAELYYVGIDKVYHPYVQPQEREVEARGTYQFDSDQQQDSIYVQRVGAGAALNAMTFTELYLLGKDTGEDQFAVESYELETKIQLTEQGQYAIDWGLLMEWEKQRSESVSELGLTLLMEKELGRWVATLNLTSEFEYGSAIKNEFDRELSAQLRYRLSRTVEPALEYYADEYTRALGPVLLGEWRAGTRSKFIWELGLLFGQRSSTADETIRASIEYEF